MHRRGSVSALSSLSSPPLSARSKVRQCQRRSRVTLVSTPHIHIHIPPRTAVLTTHAPVLTTPCLAPPTSASHFHLPLPRRTLTCRPRRAAPLERPSQVRAARHRQAARRPVPRGVRRGAVRAPHTSRRRRQRRARWALWCAARAGAGLRTIPVRAWRVARRTLPSARKCRNERRRPRAGRRERKVRRRKRGRSGSWLARRVATPRRGLRASTLVSARWKWMWRDPAPKRA